MKVVIMICLYSRIFFAIRAHARKTTAAAAARQRAVGATATAKSVVDPSHAAPPPAKPETVSK